MSKFGAATFSLFALVVAVVAACKKKKQNAGRWDLGPAGTVNRNTLTKRLQTSHPYKLHRTTGRTPIKHPKKINTALNTAHLNLGMNLQSTESIYCLLLTPSSKHNTSFIHLTLVAMAMLCCLSKDGCKQDTTTEQEDIYHHLYGL